jgi:hypothetical protein
MQASEVAAQAVGVLQPVRARVFDVGRYEVLAGRAGGLDPGLAPAEGGSRSR